MVELSRRDGDDAVVVVPELPGPLVRVPSGRDRDELAGLIDELLPDTDEGPGPFDAALVVAGGGLVGWGVFAGGPTAALVIGVITLGLGCVLPARSLWRRVMRGPVARGVPLRVVGPVGRLVRAHDVLVGVAALQADRGAVAAAHSALVEVASLLDGRAPESVAQREYVEQRAVAIEELAEALREHQGGSALDPAVVLLARAELDAVAGYNSLTRLGELAAELRAHRAGE